MKVQSAMWKIVYTTLDSSKSRSGYESYSQNDKQDLKRKQIVRTMLLMPKQENIKKLSSQIKRETRRSCQS